MKLLKTIFLFLLVAWQPTAQEAGDSVQIDLGFTPEFIDFSPDDHFMVAENDQRFQVWNIRSNTKILEGKHTFKLGRFINSLAVSTGSGYFLFGNEEVFMTIDYQHNGTQIKAFNLEDGNLLWETDQLDMAISTAETILTAHGAGNVEVVGRPMNVRHNSNNFFTRDKFLDRLINYLPQLNAIAINGKNGLQLVDLKTGETRWTQSEVTGGIGELLFDAKSKRIMAIKVPNSEGAIDQLTSKPEVQALDATTGKLLWSVEYTGTFEPGYASMVGNTLVLPYLELTFIDVVNGTERNGDIKSRLEGTRKASKVIGGIMAIDRAIHGSDESAANNKYNRLVPRELHFDSDGKLCYFTAFNEEGKLDGGFKKGYLKIDIHKDKVETEKYNILGNQWTVMQDAMADGLFYVKASGNLNRTQITALDAGTGEVVFETDKASNSADIAKSFNPFMVSNGRIVDIVSKGIYIHDAKTGKELSYTRSKDLGVGKVKYSRLYANGIILFGTKGLGILDFEGNLIAGVDAKNIRDFAATRDEVWVLEKKTFTRVDAKAGDVLESSELKKSEHVFFSPSGKTLAKFNASDKQLAIIR
ncbi:PQQ-binding-like beta-propeller repeat protein [Planktosalinus lacus]|uniref:PQQ-binding-like beta-propeller repeat protein n=1 Tax=Planktosalinus lacus TaxID=1526573 RepID=UPI001665785C|nr:PQQ-binding-like beta-propeller repeat protein [Planktosalinus lacus]